MQPWQVFNMARKYIGAENVARIFNKEKRSAYSWAQDPDYTEHRCKSPLELLHTLFVRMDDAGIGYVARAAIRHLETAVEPEHILDDCTEMETLPTITEEVLADYTALAEMQHAIATGESIAEVRSKALAAIAEIERSVAKYAQGK